MVPALGPAFVYPKRNVEKPAAICLMWCRRPRMEAQLHASTQGVCGGRVFQSGGDAEEGRAPPLMLLLAEHEAGQ
jgi:hypothetical protein